MSRWRVVVPLGFALMALSVWGLVTLVDESDRETSIDGAAVTVVITTEDIPRGQRLNPLIRRGVFKEIQVPARLLLEDAVRNISELEGLATVDPIFKNEQVTASRLYSLRVDISD